VLGEVEPTITFVSTSPLAFLKFYQTYRINAFVRHSNEDGNCTQDICGTVDLIRSLIRAFPYPYTRLPSYSRAGPPKHPSSEEINLKRSEAKAAQKRNGTQAQMTMTREGIAR